MAKVTNSKDLILLLLYAKGHAGKQCEPISGRTRLMKTVFLFEKEVRRRFNLEKKIPASALPDFTAYHYGPYSHQVFEDLEFLADAGFIQVSDLQGQPLSKEEIEEYGLWQTSAVRDEDLWPPHAQEYKLSPLGREFVESGGAGDLTSEQWEAMHELKGRCTSAPLSALLKYVYVKYPELTTKSKIKDEVLNS